MTFIIAPKNSKLLVEEIMYDDKVGSIHLPDKAGKAKGQSWLKYGIVEAVGPGHDLECGMRRSMDVRNGDIVAWPLDAPCPEIGEGVVNTLMGKKLPHLLLVDMGHVQCTIRDTDNGNAYPDTSGK